MLNHILKKHGWALNDSDYIKFGSDIVSADSKSAENDETVLKDLKINERFILTVGTIEIRKNHETLYKTYLNLLNNNIEPPLLIIAGKPEWKISSFLDPYKMMKGYHNIFVIFYLLIWNLMFFTGIAYSLSWPSMYEGWSLTLPESLSYGKVAALHQMWIL
ncbi:glycosyltransferase [Duffyella gerundensis]|uniref:glycosyltransferase n=1 Tax=Duffyella gerundensis TaxID=1619313 RepID=UPI0021F72971|nr:glycosyltransferase [Duffyella gerundensis]